VVVKYVEPKRKIKLEQQAIVREFLNPELLDGVPAYFTRWMGGDDTIETREHLMEDVPKLLEKFEKARNIRWAQSPTTHKWSFKWDR
jgi:hypothetical protein